MYDVILKDAFIADGSGRDIFKADVAVFSDSIALITSSHLTRARTVIDCKGKYLVPGFIDSHTHSDLLMLSDPLSSPRIGQGITTDISGNCGIGVFPYTHPVLKDLVRDVLGTWDEWRWSDFESFKRYAMAEKIGNNQAFLVPHTALRVAAMEASAQREATEAEIKRMCELLSVALDQGAVGFSTGLYYSPCVFASSSELLSLLKVTAERNKIFAVHHRSEGYGCTESLREVLLLALESGVRTEISHLKAIGKENQGEVDAMLNLIDEYRGRGVDVKYDQYPYTYGSTSLFSLLPPRVLAFSRLEQRMALSLDNERAQIKEEIMKPEGWDSIYPLVGPENIKALFLSSYPSLSGKTLSEIAEEMNISDPLDALFDVLEDETGLAIMTDTTQSEESLEKIMAHEGMCFGTDSLYSSPLPHPRSFHATVHFLTEYVRKKHVFTLEEAVRRMTGETAMRFGLRDRGLIEEGKIADITVFDLDELCENGGKENRGFKAVLVNGKISLLDDKVLDTRAGKILTL